MIGRRLSLCLALAVTPLLPGALGAAPNVIAFEQPKNAPDEFNMVVEIPAGGFVKYETDVKTGQLFVDRFQSMPVAYPANYGSITRTSADDGDPLDVLVFTRAPVHPGAVMKVRPIGIMKMIDGGEIDDKVVAVPVSKVDPTYDPIQSLDDLPKIELERLSAFFRVYKMLPDARKVVEVKGYEDADAAKAMIRSAMERYKD